MRRPDLVAKNATVAQLLHEGRPSIGVFRIHPKTKELISSYVEPVEHGQYDPDLNLVDSRMIHMNLWNTVKDSHPDLKHLKYDQVPRGRVFFNKEKKKFHVLGPALHLADSNIQTEIRNTYKLCESQTVFDPNEDYELEEP
jgi:hypothetical protein